MKFRRTEPRDLPALLDLFAEARGTIAKLGIDQWQDGYPYRENSFSSHGWCCVEGKKKRLYMQMYNVSLQMANETKQLGYRIHLSFFL